MHNASRYGGAEMPVRVSWVSHDFLSVLGVSPVHGRLFSTDEGRVDLPSRVLILSHDFWKNSLTVSQRTHEMGVRIALGARVKDVLRLVVGEGLGVILVGIVLGVAIALALGKLVASLLYGITPRDPVAMAAAALVLLTVGVLASLIPAWRAARVDLVRALSAE